MSEHMTPEKMRKPKPTKIKLEFTVDDDDPYKDKIMAAFGKFLKLLQSEKAKHE
jgi:hypothetical protein